MKSSSNSHDENTLNLRLSDLWERVCETYYPHNVVHGCLPIMNVLQNFEQTYPLTGVTLFFIHSWYRGSLKKPQIYFYGFV